MVENFHFIQPLWLLALIPLALIYWLTVRRNETDNSNWNKVIDAHLLPILLKLNRGKTGRSFSLLLMLAWLIGVLALANPAWEKRAVPVFQTNLSRVLVLDLSRSMDIPDAKPSRLERAKFKIEDILRRVDEGQIGLVVFAGDAFTVTPLTRDADTIRSLLSSLHSHIMPVQGSRADLGLLKAQELLQQAGVAEGQVLLIADGAEANSAISAANKLSQEGYTVSVLGVGTQQGAPIPNVRDQNDKPIVVAMQESILKQIAKAGGGRYSELLSSNADIDDLLLSTLNSDSIETKQTEDLQHQDWKSQGPWLVLLLLPLAALAFRRGWLLSIGVVVIVLGQPQLVMASVFDRIWQRQDQQADQALQAGDYEQAQQLSVDPLRRGSAAYKKGDYEQALNDFAITQSADGAYNKGNTHAQLKQYKEAISAYDEALKLQPDMPDAKDNKAKIEALLKQQEQSQKDQQKNTDSQQANSGSQSSGSQSKEEQQDSQQQDEQQKENQFAKANEQQEKEQEESKDSKASSDQKTAEQTEQTEQTAQAEREQQADKQSANIEKKQTKEEIAADRLSNEEKIAAEQWLRRIPDNPGELLKRKFKYQYKRRDQSSNRQGTPW